MEKQIIAVDLDNVICYNLTNTYNHLELLELKPNHKIIRLMYELMNQGHQVVIHTARREQDREVTKEWLLEHRVPYNDLVMGKLKANLYIDDRALRYDINAPDESNLLIQQTIDTLTAAP
jgi:hypothetical protein